jgi:hypothetical protein
VIAFQSTDESMATTIGDVAELGDVDMDHRARVRVLVAAVHR